MITESNGRVGSCQTNCTLLNLWGDWLARRMPRRRKPASPFKRFNSSPEVIRLVVMIYVRFPLSLRNVEDLLFERGIDIYHETVSFGRNRFGPMFAADICRERLLRMMPFQKFAALHGHCRNHFKYSAPSRKPSNIQSRSFSRIG